MYEFHKQNLMIMFSSMILDDPKSILSFSWSKNIWKI